MNVIHLVSCFSASKQKYSFNYKLLKDKKMKTSILMTIMGLFMAFANISFATSDSSVPACCKTQEACCVKGAACCQSENESQNNSDCCIKEEACCKSNAECCTSGNINGNYKDQFHTKVSSTKMTSSENHQASCCN